MLNDTIQVDYDQLADVANQFEQQAEECIQLTQRLKGPVEALQNGGWEGDAAKSFLAELDADVLPALQRLSDSLTEGEMMGKKIAAMMREAEEGATKGSGSGNISLQEMSAGTGTISTLHASGSDDTHFEQEFDFSDEGETITGRRIDPDRIQIDPEYWRIDPDPKKFKDDLNKGLKIRDNVLNDGLKVIDAIASMPDNPIKGRELLEDALKGEMWKGLAKSVAGSFFDFFTAHQTSDISAQRRPLWRAYNRGIVEALDPTMPQRPPKDEVQRELYNLAKKAVGNMSVDEQYHLGLGLAQTWREYGDLGFYRGRYAVTPENIREGLDGGKFYSGLDELTMDPDYDYRDPR